MGGASILPIALYRGAIILLLGQERQNNSWCSFGGGPHKGETAFQTAIREGSEELNGFLGSNKKLENIINKNLILTLESRNKHTTYIFKTNYNKDLPVYFANNNKFVEMHLKNQINSEHNGLFEKKKIEWILLDNINNYNIRPCFIDTISCLFKNKEKIIKELKNQKIK